MEYIDIENITVGDHYRCGRTTLEVLRMNYAMTRFTVRLGPNPPITLSAHALHTLLNPDRMVDVPL